MQKLQQSRHYKMHKYCCFPVFNLRQTRSAIVALTAFIANLASSDVLGQVFVEGDVQTQTSINGYLFWRPIIPFLKYVWYTKSGSAK